MTNEWRNTGGRTGTWWRGAGRALAIAFFLLHAAAVFVYSIPREDRRPLPRGLLLATHPIVSPYLFATSQWQIWNLFSPDPLRRESRALITGRLRTGEWRAIEDFTAGQTPWWRRAKRFKLLRRVTEKDSLLETFLLAHCRLSPTPVTEVRMDLSTRLVPPYEAVLAAGGWGNIVVKETRRTIGPISCHGLPDQPTS